MQVQIGLKVPATDGVLLATDVVRPDGPGPFPTILFRTCYHRRGATGNIPAWFVGPLVERGYAVVAQDVRGKYDSEGTFEPLLQEGSDGVATLDWIANQHWCNGSIGTWGRSYPGMLQMPTAGSGHPALKAIAPSIGVANFFRDWLRCDGCFALANLIRWPLEHSTCRTTPATGHFKYEDTWKFRSVDEIERFTGIAIPFLRKVAAHDRDDAFWAPYHHEPMHERVRVPGIHAAGWFDHVSRGQFEAFRNISARGATEAARKGQHLLVGPWAHNTISAQPDVQRKLGNLEFGNDAVMDVFAREMDMFDHYLRGIDNGFDREPRVKVFILGANRWASFSDWPPKEAHDESWFLGSERKLARTPTATDSADNCVFDPADPVITCGGQVYAGLRDQLGNVLGPVDQRKLLGRSDVHYYRSEPLDRALTIAGEPILYVTITSDADDTDVIAKLCVEETDGRVICLALGQLRCRYRENFAEPKPLVRGQPTPIRVRFYSIAHRFAPGSRIGLIVTHSDFPRIEPHSGTMDPPLSGAPLRSARNAILHGPTVKSRLVLPVVELD